MTTNQQLELGFNGQPTRSLGRRRSARAARAQWWFAQIRATVANAMDWESPAAGRASQIWLPDSNRGVKV